MGDNEVWKPYPEFDFIEGSSLCRVRTLDRVVSNGRGMYVVKGRILKKQPVSHGYLQVAFSSNGKTVHRKVHRIIASCFLPNPNNFPEVNHKNNDRTDNRVDNLEFCTHEYNIEYKEKYGVSSKECVPKSPIYVINLTTLEVYWFPSQREASRSLGVNLGNLSSVIKCQRNQAGGYWFTKSGEDTVENARAKFGKSVASKVEYLMNDKN